MTGKDQPIARDGSEIAEEASLWAAFKQDRSSATRQRLFAVYHPFARRLAKRHYFDRPGGDIDLLDVHQLASAGLLEAIDRFDPELGAPFRAYAARRITGSILDGIAKMSELRDQISFRNRMRRERARSLTRQNADAGSAGDAVRALTEATVGLALGFMLESAGLASMDGQPDSRATAYDSLAWKQTVDQLGAELAQLPQREQTIIRQHYLDGLTFDQIGALLGISRGRVSQLHRAALEELRQRLPHSSGFHLER